MADGGILPSLPASAPLFPTAWKLRASDTTYKIAAQAGRTPPYGPKKHCPLSTKNTSKDCERLCGFPRAEAFGGKNASRWAGKLLPVIADEVNGNE